MQSLPDDNFIVKTPACDRYIEKKPRRRSLAGGDNPLSVEFETGRMDPALKEYTEQVLRAYLKANHPGRLGDSLELESFTASNGDDGDSLQIGSIEDVAPAAYHPCNHTGPSKVGAELISGFLAELDEREGPDERKRPVGSSQKCTNPLTLAGQEINANAFLICQRLKHRAAHLYDPMIDAVVFHHTMKQIGEKFGGNSQGAAKLGREKVADGLRFAKLVFDDLLKAANQREKGPYDGRRALPRKAAVTPTADEIPHKWQQGDNDNRRRIRDVS